MTTRILVFTAFLVGLGLIVAVPAQASPFEFCPARVTALRVAGAPNTYAIRLRALTPRTVSGTLAVQTVGEWYRVPFRDVMLTLQPPEVDQPFRAAGVLYVRFPTAVQVQNAWVANAGADAGVWKGRATADCAPQLVDTTSGFDPAGAPANAIVAIALPSEAFASSDCKTPFKDATVDAMPPVVMDADAPDDASVGFQAKVVVDVDAGGRAVGASVLEVNPSSDTEYAWKAERMAMDIRYHPGIAYCHAIPGSYIFELTVTD